jgi:hypothetical protein
MKKEKFTEMESHDENPDTWAEMRAGASPEQKWDEMRSTGDAGKWSEMKASESPYDDKFHDMVTEGSTSRFDVMRPSGGTRDQGFKKQEKSKSDNKVERFTQHTEFGSTREI